MAPPRCVFYAQGTCRNGSSCRFVHDGPPSTQNTGFEETGSALPVRQRPDNNAVATAPNPNDARTPKICKWFLKGSCHYGDKCRNLHDRTQAMQPPVRPSSVEQSANLGQPATASTSATADSRSGVPCKFFSRPGGCKNSSCPYLHIDNHNKDLRGVEEFEDNKDEASHQALRPCD